MNLRAKRKKPSGSSPISEVSIKKAKLSKEDSSSIDRSASFEPCKKENLTASGHDSEDFSDTEEYDGSGDQMLSAYEKARLDNIKENVAMMQHLDLMKAKVDYADVSVKKRPQVGLKIKKEPKLKVAPAPRRISLRLQRINPEGIKLPDVPVPSEPQNEHPRKPAGPLPMKCTNEVADETCSKCLQEWAKLNATRTSWRSGLFSGKSPTARNAESYRQKLQSLVVKDGSVAKVVPDRVFSMDIHPNPDKILVAVGDKWGRVGLWDVGSSAGDDGIFLFESHSRPINCLKYAPYDASLLFSCSYDGTIRCADLNKEVFLDVFATAEEDDERCNYFSWPFGSHGVVLAASSSGEVLQLDTRSGKQENAFAVYQKSVRSIDCHPSNENIFVTSCFDGSVSLWDMRRLSKIGAKCIDSCDATKSVSLATFSPSGSKLLSTSYDDSLRVSRVDDAGRITETHRISHNNNTGRWLTSFRACWHPTFDDVFVCGSMNFPRQIDVFSAEGGKPSLLMQLRHENFTTITSVNAFHPNRNVVCGANSSGKVFVWTESNRV